jgi:DNA-binding transcriptional regulator YiaG
MTPTQLKRIRLERGLSQQALADALGVTRNTVVRWEMGRHPIPPMAVKLLALLIITTQGGKS